MLDESLPMTSESIKKQIKVLFCQHMNLPVEEVTDEDSFFSLGLTSLIHAEYFKSLCHDFGELSSTVLFEYPNFNLLSEHLYEQVQNLAVDSANNE